MNTDMKGIYRCSSVSICGLFKSKIAIGSGGLSGKGPEGAAVSLQGFLPERHTDFIFAVAAE